MIQIIHLTKRYDKTQALSDATLTFKEATVTAIMGENGAGKSTLLKICAGIMPYDQGTIIIDGKNLSKHSIQVRKNLGYLPEMPYMYDRLTGREFLLYIASLRRLQKAEKEINRLSTLLGIKPSLDNELGSYSKGMKQKISLISAIMHNPKNLLLDEPVWGLDPLTSRTLRRFISSRKGTTVIATHSPSLVEQVADVVSFLSKGTVLSTDTVSSVIEKHGSIEDAYFNEARESHA